MIVRPKPINPVLQKGHSLAQGLLLAWLFNEGGGTKIQDYSGHGWHGTAENFTLSGSWKVGRFGKMLGLDGTDDRIINLNLPALGTNPRSLIVWVKSRTQSGVNVFVSIGNSGGTNTRFGYYFSDTQLNFWNAEAGGDQEITASGFTLGYHLIIGTKPLTVGGGKTVWNSNISVAHPNYVDATIAGMVVGVNDTDTGNDWHPEVDIIATMVWNRELTAAEKSLLLGDPLTHFR